MTDPAVALWDARERTGRLVEELAGVFEQIVDASDAANLDDEHDPEGATVAFERAQVAELLDRARARLGEIDAALGRFDQGAYGVCELCGTAIPAPRLEAQPAARRCVVCATA
jgi:RNA polymerase-binding transcription factor DksA